MGPSPAEPSEVLMVFGSLMLLAALLALGFWISDYLKSHPGILSAFGRVIRSKFLSLLKRSTGQDSGRQCAAVHPMGKIQNRGVPQGISKSAPGHFL